MHDNKVIELASARPRAPHSPVPANLNRPVRHVEIVAQPTVGEMAVMCAVILLIGALLATGGIL